MTTTKEILGAVEKARGPDREIDAKLMALVYVRDKRFIGAACEGCDCADAPRHKDDVWVDPANDKWVSTHAREFTASIDAALALVEKMLPGAWWHVAKGRVTEAEPLFGAELLFSDDESLGHGEAATAPLAIIVALLRALISTESKP